MNLEESLNKWLTYERQNPLVVNIQPVRRRR